MRYNAAMRSPGLKLVVAAAISGALALLSSCSKSKPQQTVVLAGMSMANSMRFEFAVYLLPRSAGDPSAVLREALAGKYSSLKEVAEIPSAPRGMLVHARLERHALREYPPPDLKSLSYSGYGLSAEQAQALQRSDEAFILEFAHPKENVWIALRTANSLVEEIARRTGGLIWDGETREVFSPDAWRKKRLASWTAVVPDISTQTVIHIYPAGEYMRAITLGMGKAGLPDVVVQEVPASHDNQAGNLINLVCQSMAEGVTFKPSGKFNLNLHAIKDSRVRDTQLKSLKPNAAGMACLSLKTGKWEEGDPKNRLVELSADRYSGPDHQSQQTSMIDSIFGSEDEYTEVKHTDALLEASRKARAHLPELHQAFNAGLQPGEYIQLKAPFEAPDGGREWMWVEVASWKGEEIKGTLANDPFKVSGLHAGQIVEVREKDIFDYIRQYPDRHQEGNTTGRILEKLEEQNGRTKRRTLPTKPQITQCDPE
ncbi:MAG: DUF2314 domain-containing protein [Acidobacteriia bacterium]|nr:DUF2314 domain-containing protein [Terriglobia bacterium]